MMIPWYVILIPQFFIMQKLHLYDTHWSLILTGAFNVFGVFLLRQNMLSIPDSLAEAAKIEGCGPWGIYVKIILPLCKTSLATLVVLTFNSVWNDYMGPMIYLDTDSKKTIQLGLATFRRQFDTDYGAIMAGTTLSLIPVVILYAVAQKYIVEGIAYAGVKGEAYEKTKICKNSGSFDRNGRIRRGRGRKLPDLPSWRRVLLL